MASTAITTIARDENCDIYLDDDGNIAMATGLDACAQIVNAKMRTVQGELQLNLDGGLPYFTTVFSSVDYVPLWRSAAVNMLDNLDFVTEVKSFDCSVGDDGVMTYVSKIKTNQGELTING